MKKVISVQSILYLIPDRTGQVVNISTSLGMVQPHCKYCMKIIHMQISIADCYIHCPQNCRSSCLWNGEQQVWYL